MFNRTFDESNQAPCAAMPLTSFSKMLPAGKSPAHFRNQYQQGDIRGLSHTMSSGNTDVDEWEEMKIQNTTVARTNIVE